MAGPQERDASYSGTESYRYVERLIREGHDVDIVSPYIGLSYAKMLAKHARKYNVRLVTSRSRTNTEALAYLNGVMNPYRRWLKAALFFGLLSAAALALGFTEALALLVAIAAAMACVGILLRGKGPRRFKVRLCRDTFVHEKLYIADGMAIVGSANLTYSGLHRNVEHVEVITAKDRLEQLAGHFSGLWDSLR